VPDAAVARPVSGGGGGGGGSALAATADHVHDQLDALLRNLRRMAGPPDPLTLAAAPAPAPMSPTSTPRRRGPDLDLWGTGRAPGSAGGGGGSRPSTASTSAPDTARSARVRIPGTSKWLSVGPDSDDAFLRPAGTRAGAGGASTLSAAALRSVNASVSASGFNSPAAPRRSAAGLGLPVPQARTPPSGGGGGSLKLMQRSGREVVASGGMRSPVVDHSYDDYSEYGL